MLFVAVVMFVSLLFSGLVLFYAAYPGRGEQPPGAGEWLGDVMTRAVDAVPTIEEPDGRERGSSGSVLLPDEQDLRVG